jgi:periplasmic copper chaperone A
MSPKSMLAAAVLCAATITPALAQIHVDDAWVRATVPQQRATGAFMRISSDQPVRLVAVRSAAAPRAENHEMKMSEVAGIDVVPGKPVTLTPGGFHVMLLELGRPIQVGDAVPLTLVFEHADKRRTTVDVSAAARALTAGATMAPMASMASMPH